MMSYIESTLSKWEIVIGLEVHAQVVSKSKLFSGASTSFGAEPNSQVSFIDAGFPGMLPVLNEFCVEQAVKTGLGISGDINRISQFDRKNYFYADLPQGYQITQFYFPIVQNGSITIDLPDGTGKTIRVNRIHLEQDAGKSTHDQSPDKSFIDLNRAGVALMEIVSEPDIRSAEEAALYIKKLRSILRYLGTCDGDMEKGSLRCDANVSVRKPGEKLGTRCEIKNLNSIKNITKAIEYEAVRQIEIIESGGTIQQETRLFDTQTGETRMMRSKEDAFDYRYFPDPDLLPVVISDDYIIKIGLNMPELPDQKAKRYINTLGLSSYDAGVLTAEKATADYFEQVVCEAEPKLAANWISAELFGRLNKASMNIEDCKVTPENLSKLLKLISNNTISGKIAKQVFDEMFEAGSDAEEIVRNKGLTQVTDISVIEKIIREVLDENEAKVGEYLSGKEKLFGFFVGETLKRSQGKANPQIVNELLTKFLKNPQA
jgi:aspartyl-tRNA(Asn)/glutamyl-tRNA(Gln) amidotransferase subunit B